MAGFSTLTVERSGRVAIVTFRRGDQLNAMNRQMQGEIIAAAGGVG
jgi:enoyl-CoA hydratase/carnithine racemase